MPILEPVQGSGVYAKEVAGQVYFLAQQGEVVLTIRKTIDSKRSTDAILQLVLRKEPNGNFAMGPEMDEEKYKECGSVEVVPGKFRIWEEAPHFVSEPDKARSKRQQRVYYA